MVRIRSCDVRALTVPTDRPESDGTLAWSETTVVLVEVEAGGEIGLGYTYADLATAVMVRDRLAERVVGRDPMAIPAVYASMRRAVRNLGATGVAAMAISAVDLALWDLKARLYGVALCDLLGRAREAVPIYGSGGFTSYSIGELEEQLSGWVKGGIARVKMKVGRDPARDVERVQAARAAIGHHAELFVDANGAYSRKQALAMAERFHAAQVSWLEEPVSADDLDGLRLVRDRAPAGMAVAAGEYGWDAVYFQRLLAAGAVDVLQADATRCGGVSGFLQAAALADAAQVPLSSHCAPAAHLHLGCAAPRVQHLEYFHDHVRIEELLFDGVARPARGELSPDTSRPGLGLELKRSDAARYLIEAHQ